MDRRRGGDEGREEEGPQRSLGVEGGALRRQILTTAHAAVDLKVQGLGLLLEGSEGSKRREENVKMTDFHMLNAFLWFHRQL